MLCMLISGVSAIRGMVVGLDPGVPSHEVGHEGVVMRVPP